MICFSKLYEFGKISSINFTSQVNNYVIIANIKCHGLQWINCFEIGYHSYMKSGDGIWCYYPTFPFNVVCFLRYRKTQMLQTVAPKRMSRFQWNQFIHNFPQKAGYVGRNAKVLLVNNTKTTKFGFYGCLKR